MSVEKFAVVLRDGGLAVGDQPPVPLLGGEFHYWRNHPDDWTRIFTAIAEAGLTVVTSFVQWNVHEYAPGQFDFTGATAPIRNLPRWLDEAKRAGLVVHLRPGPACCEWRNSGATSFGTPWRTAFDAFWPVVAPYQATLGGPLGLLQVHNEWFDILGAYGVARGQIGNFDGFHTPPVPLWMERCVTNFHYLAAGYDWEPNLLATFLSQRYATIAELNAAWNTSYQTFEEIVIQARHHGSGTLADMWQWAFEPYRNQRFPKCGLLRLFDIISFMRQFTGLVLRRDTDHARAAGCEIPVTHNWAMECEADHNALAGIQLSGYDLYRQTNVNPWEWLVMIYDMQENMLPFCGEFMTGSIERYMWGGQGIYDEKFARFSTLAYFGNGLKGINHYMFVERDNWLQCPIDARGGLRPTYDALAAVHQGLRTAAWHERKRLADLLIVKLPEYMAGHPAPDPAKATQPNVEAFSFRGVGEDYVRACAYGTRDPKMDFYDLTVALHESGIDFEVASAAPAEPGKHHALWVYVLEGLDRPTMRKLEELCNRGMTVVIGPGLPTHTWDGRLMTFLEDLFGLQARERKATAGIKLNEERVLKPASGDTVEVLTLIPGERVSQRIETLEGDTLGAIYAHGKGQLVALGCMPHDFVGLTEYLWLEVAKCTRYAKTSGTPLSDAHVFRHATQKPAVIVYNGDPQQQVTALELDGSVAPKDSANLLNLLSGEITVPALHEQSGRVVYDLKVAPRDAVILRFTPGTHHTPTTPDEVEDLAEGWTTWKQDWPAFVAQWAEGAWREGWIEVPTREWTLPAIASGQVFGVQGWFWLKQSLAIPSGDGLLYLRVKPIGFDQSIAVYVNGHLAGTVEVERKGVSASFDLSHLKLENSATVALRVYRQSLDCHDVSVAGFETLQLQRDGGVSQAETLWLRQEGFLERNIPDKPGKKVERNINLPLAQDMLYGQDVRWLHRKIQLTKGTEAKLLIEGSNGRAEIWIDGEYITSTPHLPVMLKLGKVTRGKRDLHIRWTPDRDEWYHIPGGERYQAWIEDMPKPIASRLAGMKLIT